MKRYRWLLAGSLGVLLLLLGYGLAYRLLPRRDQERFRNADVYVHSREFSHDWQVTFFAPAGYAEFLLIRANPEPFLSQPSWAGMPQVVLLEANLEKRPFPADAFKRPHAY